MDLPDKFCKFFQENNQKEFLELFKEDATYIDCLYGLFKGKKEIAKFLKKCHNEAEHYNFIPKNKIFQNSLISFEWDFSFVSKMPLSKDKKITIQGCSFIKTDNSKISYYRDYSDSILFLLEGNIPENKIIEFYKRKFFK
jgi:limonene-1,2-epoxide hydrolase